MKAKVIKTGEIINLINKQGEYFITDNSTPYKEEELEFGIIEDAVNKPNSLFEFPSLTGLFQNKTMILSTVVNAYVNRKDLTTKEIEEAIVSLMEKIKYY